MGQLKSIGLFLLIGSFYATNIQAQTPPAVFNYQGRIYKSNGTDTVNASSVLFRVQIYSPDGTCLLYEETHTRDMSASDGMFSLSIGAGTNTHVSSLNLFQLFENTSVKTGASGCTYTPVAGDSRRLRFGYNDGTEALTFPNDQVIQSVPYAMTAQNIEGVAKTQILQVSAQTTQTKLDTVFNGYASLVDLINGTSSLYSKATDLPVSGGVLNLAGGGVKVADTPTSAQYAVNKNYVDSHIGGQAIDVSSVSNGQALTWNSSLNKWQGANASGGTLTSITAGSGLSGGTITTSGTISLSSVGTAGTYAKVTTDAQGRVTAGATLAASDIPAPAGDLSGTYSALSVAKIKGVAVSATAPTSGQVLKYNSSTSQWEPNSDITNVGTLTSIVAGTGLSGGTITSSGTIALSNVGTAGTYAKVTTDAQGRVTAGATLAASDIPAPAGDLSGTYSALSVAKIKGVPVSGVAPTSGQVLKYNSVLGQWEAGTDSSNAGTVTSVTAASPLSVATGSSTPVISLAAGGSAGQSLVWDGSAWGSGFGNAAALKNSFAVAQFPTTTCSTSKTLVYQVPTDTYACFDIAISATQVSGLGTAATLSVGTGAGSVAAGNDSRIVGALQGSTTVNGDLSGTFASPNVAKIQGVAVSTNTPNDGQVLKYNATTSAWEPGNDNSAISSGPSAGGTVTSIIAGTGLAGGTITTSGTLSLANIGTAGTYAKVTTDAKGRVTAGASLAASDIPAPAGDLAGTYAALSVAKIKGVPVSATAPTDGQILKYNSSSAQWEPNTDNSNVGTLTSIVAGTGLDGGTITGSGTISLSSVGTAGTYAKVTTDAQGRVTTGSSLAASDIPAPAGDLSGTYSALSVSKIKGVAVSAAAPTNGQILKYNSSSSQWEPNTDNSNAGTVTSIVAGTGLSGGTITGSGTIALASVGTAGTYFKVTTDAQGRVTAGASLASGDIPAPAGDISGTYSSLTVAKIKGVAVSATAPTDGQILKYNATTSQWEPNTDNSNAGTVTSIIAGTGLSGGTITGSGTISLSSVGTAGTYTKLTTDAYGRVTAGASLAASDIPAPAGDLSGTYAALTVAKIKGIPVSAAAPTDGQILKYNSVLAQWEPNSDNSNAGTVTSIVAGTGLSGGTITGSGTISLSSVGTAGTYAKVTTDAYGRVTAGASLASSDIPAPAGDLSGTYAALTVAKIKGVAVSATAPTDGQILKYNASTSQWEPNTDNSNVGTVTSIVAGTGLSGGTITGSGTIALASVGTAGTYTKLTTDAYGRVTAGASLAASDIPAPTGDLSGTYAALTVAKIKGVPVSATAPTSGQILKYNSVMAQWEPGTDNSNVGTVTTVTASSPLSVAMGTSTPAISLVAGTSTGQNFIWSGSAWTAGFNNASGLRNSYSVTQFPTTTCAASKTMVYQVPSDTYACVDIAITAAQVSGLGGASALEVGTVTGSVAAGDDSRIVGALQSATAVSGDLSGTFGSPSVAKIKGVAVSSTAPTNGQVLKYNSTTAKWEPNTDNSNAGSVTSITAGSGLSGGTITGSGTISLPSVGTAGTYTKLTTDAYGRVTAGASLASGDIPAPAGDVTGTYAALIVSKLKGVAVSSTAPSDGQVLKYNATTSQWEPNTDNSNVGTVTSIVAGTGLTGGTVTASGTLAVDVGTAASKIVQLDSSARLPAVDGSQLTGLPIPFSTGQAFNSSGTFTVPAKITKVFVQAWGGGGGGGNGTSGGGSSGGGGAAGGYSSGYVTVTPAGTITVTVGASGAAVTDGGASSFSTYIVANGGSKGLTGSTATSAGGAASGTSALITVSGGAGGGGTSSTVLGSGGVGGFGGSTGGGGGAGGGGGGNNVAGAAGATPGGGGGGGGSTGTAGAAGGAGGAGRVIVWY